MTKAEIKKDLMDSLENVKSIAVNGVQYFGNIDTKDDVTTITNAVEAGESLDATVRTWIKKKNLNQLEKLTVSGDATFVTKELNDDQKDEVEMIVLQAAKASATAVTNLINEAF